MTSYKNPHGLWGKRGRGVWLVLVSIVVLIIVLGSALKKWK